MQITNLKTEYKKNPIGIDIKNPRFSWQIISGGKNVKQIAYKIIVLNENGEEMWTSGKVDSDKSVGVEYAGKPLESSCRYFWEVEVWTEKSVSALSERAFFETALFDSLEWRAEWIHPVISEDKTQSSPSPILEKGFKVDKEIKSAKVYVTALGLYEIEINGERVGDALFTPGWTSYKNRIQYQSYDVTESIKEGENIIRATLGDGWYRGHLAGWIENNRNWFGDKLALLLQLKIRFKDNSEKIVCSDETWRAFTGAIRASDIYNGEIYDARLEAVLPAEYNKVEIINKPKDILIAQEGPPVKRIQEITPIEKLKTPRGETVIDFGQNMVGWVKIKVKGKAGEKVVLRHAEILDPKGNFYTDNLKGAKQRIEYILKGDPEGETFEPHFTFQGFRYVSVDEFPCEPEKENFTGIVVHSDMEITGSFECSNPLINKLQQNILWGQKDNFLDVPTDCPQRSERLGWTGDAQVFVETAAYNMDVDAFFMKWLGDLCADQFEDGAVTHIVPYIPVLGEGGAGGAAWADAAVIVPWAIYKTYDDVRVLERNYECMKKWVEFMREKAGETYLYTSGFHYGDWLAFTTERSDYPGATTEKDLIASAFFGYSTKLLARVAEILGEKEDKKFYENLFEKIKSAFQNEFVTPNGRLVSHTQTAYLLALAFDLLPERLVKRSAKYLAEDVKKFGHITTGFVGTPFICHILTRYGYNDLAYMLLTREEYPSWLYPITKGATTIWERWDGIKPDGTINTKSAFSADEDDMMNSFNHYAYGAIGDWMYKTVAGINQEADSSGFKRIVIKPQPGGGLTFAKACFNSVYGEIKVEWKLSEDEFYLKVNIPPNTTAKVILPGEGEETARRIGSGEYEFRQ